MNMQNIFTGTAVSHGKIYVFIYLYSLYNVNFKIQRYSCYNVKLKFDPVTDLL